MRTGPFHFVFEETLASTDRSVSALTVVGMHAYIDDSHWHRDRLPANFNALINHLSTLPTIRATILLFVSFEHLQKSMEPFLSFLQALIPATEAMNIFLAYQALEEGRKAVGVDLATLERNGA